MAADCEQTRGRMLELLYGELSAAARAEVEAHVAGCAGCRAELRALESTRGLARQALAADAPPTRVRAAILQAAGAAARPRTPARASRWDRLRARWTLPTFATIGAVAVFLLASRIFMEPEKTYERGRQGLAPQTTDTSPAAPAPARPPVDETNRPASSAGAAAKPASRPASSVGAVAKPAKEDASDHLSDLASGTRRQESQPTPAPRRESQPPAHGSSDNLLDEEAPAAAPRAFAPPPPAAREREQRAQKKVAGEMSDDAVQADETRPAGVERRAGGAAAPAAKRSQPSAPQTFAAPAAEPAPAPPPARETPVARADRLFAQRRWTEAAAAYRELLRDDPRSPEAARWKQRLAACEAAAAAAP